MTKDELICNLKNFKKNISSRELKERKLNKLLLNLHRLKNETPGTPIASAPGINNDIRSKNKISTKVENAVVNKLTEIGELEAEIKKVEYDILCIEDDIEETRIRLEALTYREQEIVKAHYFEGRNYEEIGETVYFELFQQYRTGDTIKRIITQSINKMANI